MTMQVVSVGFGKVTFATSSASLSAFKVEPVFERVLASKALTKVGQTQRIPASDKPQFDGWLYQDTINAPEGTILCAQLQVRSNGVAIRDGSIFLRIRGDAPLIIITAHMPASIGSTLQANNCTAFSGRADLLTIEELAEYDITPSKNYVTAFCQEDEIGECFTITEASQGVAKPVVERLVNSQGETVVFNAPRLTRRIRVKR